MDEFDSLEKKNMQHWRALMRAKLESGASFSFVWLTILIILLIPIFALIQKLLKRNQFTLSSSVKQNWRIRPKPRLQIFFKTKTSYAAVKSIEFY